MNGASWDGKINGRGIEEKKERRNGEEKLITFKKLSFMPYYLLHGPKNDDTLFNCL